MDEVGKIETTGSHLHQQMSSFMEYFCLTAEEFSNLGLESEFTELEQVFVELLGTFSKLEDVRNFISQPQNIDSFDAKEFDRKLVDTVKVASELKRSSKYRQFIRSFSEEMEIDDDDSSDILIKTSKSSLKCPLTQALFVEPIKNPSCGHTYSKSAAQQFFANRSSPCPVSGCKMTVSFKSLIPDLEMERKLRKINKK